ncbi:OprO/OprP family phosphate-selective porin [Luteibacter aegosomaticola]|uniref:OprO/OprP family phosphate-selective porin n=1 Tax=Luteibacter aegosomaticola TaxID=2911538 RepID=UPI001FF8C538|nr:OprO/OprP family phosphate-selective porin [Luteibacter aegosomaticola]UPG90959.1 OprO/OprP family phosphate-selective porin [Luteibacter aegosomaticola]
MTRRSYLFALAITLGFASLAHAQEVKVHAFADARLVDAPDDTSFIDSGPGRTRYGDDAHGLRFGAAGIVVTAQITPAVFALADVQVQRTDHNDWQVPEVYVRYRPLSLSAWRFALKGGVYFLPISLENDGIGWTSPWTITPSAINSWVGEEIRGIGVDAHEEWRGETGTATFGGGLVRHNDVAGQALAARGWSLSDVTLGLGGRLPEPDDEGGHERYAPYQSVGGRTGWYADAGWASPRGFQLRVLRYENRADPAASRLYNGDEHLYAWRTHFWSLGAELETGPVTWIAQDMDGDTEACPPYRCFRYRFQSAFLLAGWNRGAWRPTLRYETFRTWADGERGHALTAALNWRPLDWLRLTAEWLRVDASRAGRLDFGLAPRERGNQVQLLARLLY